MSLFLDGTTAAAAALSFGAPPCEEAATSFYVAFSVEVLLEAISLISFFFGKATRKQGTRGLNLFLGTRFLSATMNKNDFALGFWKCMGNHHRHPKWTIYTYRALKRTRKYPLGKIP